jgi:hypothetical protein
VLWVRLLWVAWGRGLHCGAAPVRWPRSLTLTDSQRQCGVRGGGQHRCAVLWVDDNLRAAVLHSAHPCRQCEPHFLAQTAVIAACHATRAQLQHQLCQRCGGLPGALYDCIWHRSAVASLIHQQNLPTTQRLLPRVAEGGRLFRTYGNTIQHGDAYVGGFSGRKIRCDVAHGILTYRTYCCFSSSVGLA